ncbi:hypothetical protein [Phenylobacterium sp. 58.2.17]|uniref:hypothetical protein n=1 Tax=Phenylobacterium sp. 58.2.17 TaxID=2969306 RepID=UPI0022641F75|nr:hypothetical protein [Phenylobacterium sp. 58.2.17]MCX7586570.1 hypothetical protein [Phenylobacterium sp. 58.2.17]
MSPLAALGRLAAFRRVLREPPQPFVHRHGQQEVQARQRRAAREAFLSDLPPGQRLLAARSFGDLH